MKHVFILAVDGVFDSSLAVTLNILSSAKKIHEIHCQGLVSTQVKTCSPLGKKLKTGEGLELKVDTKLDAIKSGDYIIVPGLGINDSLSLEGFLSSKKGDQVIAFLKRMYDSGSTMVSSCSATFLFAEAGIFDNQSATTCWWLSGVFRAKYPQVNLQTDQMIVSGKRYICAGAAMAQADLMMAVIRSIYGEKTARLTADYLLIDQRQFQSQYIHSGLVARSNPLVGKAELWIRNNIMNKFSITDVANALGVSTRTLARRFVETTGESPIKFIQRIRVEYVIHYLETTNYSFEKIATKVGYQDISSLRRVLYEITGKSPRQLRAYKP